MSKKIITLIAVVASLNALAQKDSSKLTNLDEVVVTATKFPIKTSATGKVITVITQQQLEQSGGKDLAQILAEQTSIVIAGANSNAGKDKSIYLRGADQKQTLITIDGVPMYDPSGIGSNFDIRNISINLIERIEILKGSQSTLYGSDAMAGVINIITKKANTNKQINYNGLLSYGSNNSINGNAGIAGKLKEIDYSFGYNYNKTDGISEAISTNANADNDGYKQESFQANLGFHPTKKISIKPYLNYTYLKASTDQGAFIDELDYTYTQKSFIAGVKNELMVGKTPINILYSYNKIERTSIDDSTLSRNGYAIYSNTHFAGAAHFIDVYSKLTLCKSTSVTLGVDYRTSNLSKEDIYAYGGGFSDKYTYGKDSLHQSQTGVYAAFNITNNTNFNIELGGRYNKHSTYGSNGVFNINPSYQITDDIKVFANISSAYRTPSLYQMYSEYGNKNLKPEVGLTTEFGLQHYFNDKKIKTQLVFFSRNIKDVIYFQSTFMYPYGYYANRDEQRDLGVEYEFAAQLTKGTTVKAFYSFVDGIISTKNKSGLQDSSFHNLLKRPKHSFGINVSSQITKKLFASANLNSIGKRADAFFNNTTYATDNVTLEGYVLVDLYAEYSLLNNKLKIFANAKNVGNTKYVETSGYNTLGSTIYGGVRFNF
jgi:vitamin B12 transporter